MKGIFALLFSTLLCKGQVLAQQPLTENVIVVTLDGMRWQDVFFGPDTALLGNPAFTRNANELKKRYLADSPAQSREKLMPFLWKNIVEKGAILGNRTAGNKVNNANPYWFSYPGYNELLTGYPDTNVNSNDKKYNQNITVLEYLNHQKGFEGKVAAFATWDVFPFIINAPRSGVFVNAGMDKFPAISEGMSMLNTMQQLAPQPIGVRPDVITYMAARAYLVEKKSRVLYIAFDETDDYAHSGMYHEYLKAAHAEDAMIADLWQLVQSMPEYKDKTTLIITTDHGRGDKNKEQWRDHGTGVADAGEVWIAAMGNGVKALGEMKTQASISRDS